MSTGIPTGIDRIPPEILGEIFTHCLSADDEPQETTQVLSSVCERWRVVALATPALWASLDITCDISGLDPPLPAIHAQLQRSGAHPLSFVLRAASPEYLHEANPNLLPVLAALAAARERWCNVDITLAWMTPEILDLITLGDAPLLQSMQFFVMENQETLPIPLRMLHHCPRLESFQWNSFGSPILLPLVDTSLTSLSLRTILSVAECTTLLRLCPRLSRAKFYNLYSSNPSPTSHLTHPTVTTLTAVGELPDTLLAALTLPALLKLVLLNGDTMSPFSTEWEIAIPAFLERSKPPLHTLSLSMPHMRRHEPALLRILALTPHLRRLKLDDSRPYAPALTAVVICALHPLPPPSASLCPRLQKMDLFLVSDCPDGLYTAMLRARCGAQARANRVACLKLARINFKGGVHDRDQADMRELRAKGMRGVIYLRDPK